MSIGIANSQHNYALNSEASGRIGRILGCNKANTFLLVSKYLLGETSKSEEEVESKNNNAVITNQEFDHFVFMLDRFMDKNKETQYDEYILFADLFQKFMMLSNVSKYVNVFSNIEKKLLKRTHINTEIQKYTHLPIALINNILIIYLETV